MSKQREYTVYTQELKEYTIFENMGCATLPIPFFTLQTITPLLTLFTFIPALEKWVHYDIILPKIKLTNSYYAGG